MSGGADLPAPLGALVDAASSVIRASASGRTMEAGLGSVLPREQLPARARARLDDALERTCKPLSRKDVERALKDAWDRAPGKVLDDLDPEPLAVRPAAQVHRATLDGAAVAVKVRRPGLARAARNDLSLVDGIAPALGRVLPSSDAGALLREIRERLGDELDLESEAAGQRRAARALRRVEGVRVPAVTSELCAPAVMVSELLEGPTLAEAAPEDPGAVARTLIGATIALGREAQIAPADARPAHVILCPDGTLGLLGLGVAGTIDRDRLEALLGALRALGARDAAALDAAVAALGLLGAEESTDLLELVANVLGPLVDGPALLDLDALEAIAERALDASDRLLPLAGRLMVTPSDLWPLRGIAQLAVTLAGLEATEDWVAVATAT